MIHILNGDALTGQLPQNMRPYIVMRECLIEGPIVADGDAMFWNNRAAYLVRYSDDNSLNYMKDVRDEFKKIDTIGADEEVCLWFEYDLFCQTNMWFVIHYILTRTKVARVYWCHPGHEEWSGFGRMSKPSLGQCYKDRIEINRSQLVLFSKLWLSYVSRSWDEISDSALLKSSKFESIYPAIEALLALHPDSGDSAPVSILRDIQRENPGSKFGELFQKFCGRAGVYGYGDVQVKYLLDHLDV